MVASLSRQLAFSLALALLGCWLSTSALASGEPDALTLRLRDGSVREVVWVLFHVTGQGYVVDGDVIGKVNVELDAVSAREVERLLSGFGVSFSGPGSIRRVSATAVSEPQLRGVGFPISLEFVRPADMRDFLRLMADITGNEILAPPGPLGRFSLFATEIPAEDQLNAALASAGLESRRDGERILVLRRGEPRAVLLPLNAGGLVGHVAYRQGEGQAAATRMPGMAGYLASESNLWGLVASHGAWTAVVRGPDGWVYLAEAGQRLFDGVIESVDGRGAIVRREDGKTITWRLRPEAEGITPAAEDLSFSFEHADALLNAGNFDESERVLVATLGAELRPEEVRQVRAAIGDLHYRWSQSLSADGELERAIRHLEAALEIDRPDRPWQAAEDLNEIGKAWTALGEPERAVSPHREALEIARSGLVRKAPQPFSCVRAHERTPWIEADALDGLANAERVRGRLSDAAKLYERALSIWMATNDATGRSAALTGLGLVRQGLGQFERAAKLHREALALSARHPVVRAIVLNNLGSAQLGLRQPDAALASFEEALGIYRKLQHRSGEGTVLNNIGAYWETRSDLARARDCYAEALAASREADDRGGEAITRGHIERLVKQHSDTDAATQRCRSAP